MTVSSSTNKVSYNGNGVLTTFAYTFKIFDEDDLTVILRASDGTETVQTITTHYTVTGVGDAGGGNVEFVTAPTATQDVVILREQPLTQGLDIVPNDPFPAQNFENALDKLTFMVQQQAEELGRSIKASRTTTLTSSEFTSNAADRANKIFAFDGNGDLDFTQEIGTFQGNWAASTTYAVRDIVKDSSNNNIYIANTAHTSSGSLPLSGNADIAKWDILVDAASAASSAAAAAGSAAAASSSATSASASASAAAASSSSASGSAAQANVSAINAASSASDASTSETNAAASEGAANTSKLAAASSASSAASSASAASASETASAASEVASAASEAAAAASETAAATSEGNALTYKNAAETAKTAAETAQTAAEAAQAAAELAADNFDDTYLGSKSSDPTVDNDGGALNAGDLYFNTTSNTLRVYSGSAWQDAAIDSSGFVQTTGDTLTGDLSFGDNDKAIFGAGSDLQIYHDGSHSYIDDAGTGNLYIRGEQVRITNADGTVNGIQFNPADSGRVKLFFDDATKLQTTSTGIDVTGTVTADGLTVDGSSAGRITLGQFTNTTNAGGTEAAIALRNQATGNADVSLVAYRTGANFGSDFYIETSDGVDGTNRKRLNVGENGDISFYEDTGTTAKFFWDASAESLGIGTSSPSSVLHAVNSASSGEGIATFEASSTKNGYVYINGDDNRRKSLVFQSGGVDKFSMGVGDSDELSTSSFFIGSGKTGGSGADLVIDSSGNVGIGTSVIASRLNIEQSSDSFIGGFRTNSPTSNSYAALSMDDDDAFIVAGNAGTESTNLRFYTSSSGAEAEAMRIDSGGNLLVGKTSAAYNTDGFQIQSNGISGATTSAGRPFFVNRKSTDGAIVDFYKDGTTVGSIGTTSGTFWFAGNSTQDTGIRCYTVGIAPCDNAGVYKDNSRDLGSITVRWDDVYATNGTIQTSDQNEKQDIAELSDAEQRVAVAAKGLLRKFRWKDAVAEKGDEARTHFGIIAQDLQAAFAAEGLDAGNYAMFIHTTWTDEETGEERSRMGVRYSELLAFIIAAI